VDARLRNSSGKVHRLFNHSNVQRKMRRTVILQAGGNWRQTVEGVSYTNGKSDTPDFDLIGGRAGAGRGELALTGIAIQRGKLPCHT
jgi:hypothetical protein